MKKRMVIVGMLAAFLAGGVINATLASFQTTTKEMGKVDIKTQELRVGLHTKAYFTQGEERKEKKKEEENLWSGTFGNILPGKEWTESIVLENQTKEKQGYPFYARIVIYKAWGEERDGVFIKDYNLNPKGIQLKLIEEEAWICVPVDEEQSIYYYKYPLQAGEKSEEMLQKIKIANELGNEYMGKSMNMIVRADAVQAVGKEDAFLSVWGIEPEFDENGTMISWRKE